MVLETLAGLLDDNVITSFPVARSIVQTEIFNLKTPTTRRHREREREGKFLSAVKLVAGFYLVIAFGSINLSLPPGRFVSITLQMALWNFVGQRATFAGRYLRTARVTNESGKVLGISNGGSCAIVISVYRVNVSPSVKYFKRITRLQSQLLSSASNLIIVTLFDINDGRARARARDSFSEMYLEMCFQYVSLFQFTEIVSARTLSFIILIGNLDNAPHVHVHTRAREADRF